MSDAAEQNSAPVRVEVFPRAPISEVILGIGLPYLDDIAAYIEPFHAAVADRFPHREVVHSPDLEELGWPARVDAHNRARSGDANGYRLLSEDRLQVVQLTRRGLTYHRLRPYIDWGHFAQGAIPVWRAFAKTFAPEFVTNLRLRYLNRIEIPSPTGDLEQYLTLLLKIPGPVDNGFTGYLMRITLWEHKINAYAHVTQLMEPQPNAAFESVIFDIDVRMDREIIADERKLWDAVEALREYKNRIFFSSITENTRDLFR